MAPVLNVMNAILHGYQVNEPTWFYLSLLLILSVFFRFGRIFSLRNFDLALMLAIAPALLFAQEVPAKGAFCLVAVTLGLLARTIFDASFTRRPKLPQNMNPSGLTFLCVSALAFMGTKVLTDPPPANEVLEVQRAQQLVQGLDKKPGSVAQSAVTGGNEAGPSSRLIYALAATPTQSNSESSIDAALYGARFMAIAAHLAVVLGLVCLGTYHMGDFPLGIAMATLYLLLPCTAFEVGRVNHVLPSALIVWAFVAYRHVMVAGALLGLACGSLFFPVFLLPVWMAFYAERGWARFILSVGAMTLAIVAGIWLLSGATSFNTQSDFGFVDWTKLQFRDTEPTGFWSIFPAAYRIPAFVSFLAMVTALTIWPRQKNLAHLMAHSAAIVIGTQLWYPQQGSVYVLWYLPLLLMVVFRPPLHHSVAPDLARQSQTVTTAPEVRTNSTVASGISTGTAFR
ncbi:MAG: hypothetical protein JWM11_2900 [Planctomycetaceae bacterium]|nr:hypothetical protein [Planctomycetaceae bacterium]